MPLSFYDCASGEKIGSTLLAKNVLAAATENVDSNLHGKILGLKNWRKQYQGVYRDLAQTEFFQEQNLLEIARVGLEKILNSVRDESGRTISQIVEAGWVGRQQVETFVIQGSGLPVPLNLANMATLTEAAQIWSQDQIAEPGLVSSFKFLDAHKKLPISSDVLVALAGAAEYAPTRYWLQMGGTVAVAARPGAARWLSLIAQARKSGGVLLVPVLSRRLGEAKSDLSDISIADLAGLDLVEDAEELASWVASISRSRSERIVLGQYAYAPGAKHIIVQAVQDAFANLVSQKLAPTRIAFAWLATPTDSTVVPAGVLGSALDKFKGRSFSTKLRDSLLLMKKTPGKYFESRFGEKLALIDPTSSVQGSSYALAKRSQRWRAYLANSQGIKVSYAVSPPARTHSVLSFKILNATYRGAPSFGLKPFEVADAAIASTAVLLRDLHGPMHSRGSTSLHSENAIHGGLWRLAYRPSSVWTRATILGWRALLKPSRLEILPK